MKGRRHRGMGYRSKRTVLSFRGSAAEEMARRIVAAGELNAGLFKDLDDDGFYVCTDADCEDGRDKHLHLWEDWGSSQGP
jgi:hypothetical protein